MSTELPRKRGRPRKAETITATETIPKATASDTGFTRKISTKSASKEKTAKTLTTKDTSRKTPKTDDKKTASKAEVPNTRVEILLDQPKPITNSTQAVKQSTTSRPVMTSDSKILKEIYASESSRKDPKPLSSSPQAPASRQRVLVRPKPVATTDATHAPSRPIPPNTSMPKPLERMNNGGSKAKLPGAAKDALSPKYKATERRVLAIIVGLPFVIVLGYELVQRQFYGKERATVVKAVVKPLKDPDANGNA